MSKTIFERIELEKRGKEPNEVRELNLDNCRGLAEVDDDLRSSLAKFSSMECLSLINANLSSVKNFPCLPKLKKLELSDNRISSGLDSVVKNCPNLTHLSLSGNKIAEYDALKVLENLASLRSLDLFNCEVTTLDDYREKVFDMLPKLEFLDGYDRDDKEDLEDEEYGDGDIDGALDPDADDAEVEIDEDDDDDDDDNDDLDEDEDDELGEEEEDNVGLDYLQKDNLDLDSEGEDFNPDGEENDEDVTVEDGEDDDDEDDDQTRGKKRKHEEEEKDEGVV